jgi:hypothetical protein
MSQSLFSSISLHSALPGGPAVYHTIGPYWRILWGLVRLSLRLSMNAATLYWCIFLLRAERHQIRARVLSTQPELPPGCGRIAPNDFASPPDALNGEPGAASLTADGCASDGGNPLVRSLAQDHKFYSTLSATSPPHRIGVAAPGAFTHCTSAHTASGGSAGPGALLEHYLILLSIIKYY